jgi:hypothetical protein
MMWLRIVDLHVGDDQEAVQQLAAAVEQREVLLVLLHGQDQALLRHVEVFGFECADIDDRPFDQRRHLVEQALGRVDAGVRVGLPLWRRAGARSPPGARRRRR